MQKNFGTILAAPQKCTVHFRGLWWIFIRVYGLIWFVWSCLSCAARKCAGHCLTIFLFIVAGPSVFCHLFALWKMSFCNLFQLAGHHHYHHHHPSSLSSTCISQISTAFFELMFCLAHPPYTNPPCYLFCFTCLHNASCMLTCTQNSLSFMRTPHGSRLQQDRA